MRLLLALPLLVLLVIQSPANAEFRAGAAATDITPQEFPINMPGNFRANYAEGVHDPFHSRAIVLDDGHMKIAMLVVDNLGVDPEVMMEAKQIASKKTGIPVNKMMISSTHTHSGPPSNDKDGPTPHAVYRELLVKGIAQSIVDANAALEPASAGAASHALPEEVFNRRWFLKPGKMPPNPFGEMDIVKMNPPRSPDVLDRPAGPTDPDITIISLQNARKKPLALFANYSLHYVGAIPRGQVSSDYFGEFARLMPNRLRADDNFVAMMSNGTSGDINNIPFNAIRAPREPFEQVQVVARKAADTAWLAHQKVEHQTDITLGMKERDIVLKHREISPKQLEEAKRVAALTDEDEIKKLPRLAQIYARRTIDLASKGETVTVKLQAIRIGDLIVCAIPFETFVEIGLELKERSLFPQTMVVGLANGRYGYLPTPEQHRLGGYETWIGTNRVQKDASVILVNNLMEMMADLKAESGKES